MSKVVLALLVLVRVPSMLSPRTLSVLSIILNLALLADIVKPVISLPLMAMKILSREGMLRSTR
jgi:hypothetical protein